MTAEVCHGSNTAEMTGVRDYFKYGGPGISLVGYCTSLGCAADSYWGYDCPGWPNNIEMTVFIDGDHLFLF